MGQFSWCCALCDREVMHGRQPGFQWTTDAVILWPNGDKRSGRYEDGYGRIAGVELTDQLGGWRLVHQRCLDEVKRFTTEELFASFCEDRHAADQGWWPGERLAVERYGDPERLELKELQTYVCYECKHVWQAHWSGGNCPFGCVRPKNYGDDAESISKGYGDCREMVEPFRYRDYRSGHADGVIVCRNEAHSHTDWAKYHALPRDERDDENMPKKIEPCFRFNEPQQARVTKTEDWEEDRLDDEPKEFVIRCRSCQGTDVEVMSLIRVSGEPSVVPSEG